MFIPDPEVKKITGSATLVFRSTRGSSRTIQYHYRMFQAILFICTGLRVPCCGSRGEHQREHHPEGCLGRGIGKFNLEATERLPYQYATTHSFRGAVTSVRIRIH
jgi:hypothetical protein